MSRSLAMPDPWLPLADPPMPAIFNSAQSLLLRQLFPPVPTSDHCLSFTMPELQDCSYSQDEVVVIVRDFFNFLKHMFLPYALVKEPPEGGWPSISSEKVAMLGKNETVGELLRQLPIIVDPDVQWYPKIEWEAWPQNFEREEFEAEAWGHRIRTEDQNDPECVPSDVIGLTSGNWEDSGTMLLDTTHGVIYWFYCPGSIGDHPSIDPIDDDPYDWATDKDASWRNDSMAWSVPDFFKVGEPA